MEQLRLERWLVKPQDQRRTVRLQNRLHLVLFTEFAAIFRAKSFSNIKNDTSLHCFHSSRDTIFLKRYALKLRMLQQPGKVINNGHTMW